MESLDEGDHGKTMSKRPILVLGATGKTGRRIVHLLHQRGESVREASRSSACTFDWDVPATWAEAVRGVRAVYVAYVPDLAAPQAPAAIEGLFEACRRAGVEHVVLLSGRGEANAQRCERIVADSGIPFTLLRASWFAQNFSEGHLVPSAPDGIIALPAGEVREPFIDVDDIAEVACAALLDPHPRGDCYELTGPRLLSFADAAAEMSAAAGQTVTYVPISLHAFYEALIAQAGPEFATLYTGLCREVFDGRNASLGDGVQRALGRPPRDFSDFCRQAAATGVWRR